MSLQKLLTIIKSNNHEMLDTLINSNKNIKWTRGKYSLIYRAIEYRAKECFDLMINNDKFKLLLESDSGKRSGLLIATQYMIEFPSAGNKYYFDKLIEKNVCIDIWSILHSIKNINIFNVLFDSAIKNSDLFIELFYEKIDNIEVLNKIYNYMTTNNVEYYNDNFNKNVYNLAIRNNNVLLIDYLITVVNICWKECNDVPALYCCIRWNAFDAFNYLYLKHEQMTTEELNSIPNIKDIDILALYGTTFTPIFTKYMIKLIKLKIAFNSIEHMFVEMFYKICKDYTGIKIIKIYKMLDTFLKYNLVKNNPLNLISLDLMNEYIASSYGFNNTAQLAYKNNINTIKILCLKYNYMLPEHLITHNFFLENN